MQLNRWAKALHFFYAGLYAFVLPLICWGAQATPGHPHARAHFVFVEPVLAASSHTDIGPGFETSSGQVAPSLQAWLAEYGDSLLCHTPLDTAGATEPADTPTTPAGRSVPSQLAIASLLPLTVDVTAVFVNANETGFTHWLPSLFSESCLFRVPTPPPRA